MAAGCWAGLGEYSNEFSILPQHFGREMNLREDWSFTIMEKAAKRQSHLKHYSDTMLKALTHGKQTWNSNASTKVIKDGLQESVNKPAGPF